MSMRQLKISKSITNRESQSLEKYLGQGGINQPGRRSKISSEKIKQGDERAAWKAYEG